jgi:TRAP-type C4-dicarboxylate transport system permease small subunit
LPAIVTRPVRLAALLAGYALLVLAFLIAAEILGRKLFNWSLQGVDELGGYALAVTASLGFGYAVLERAHTRVDVFLRLLPAPLRGLLHALAWTSLAAVALLMLWHARGALSETLLFGSIANSPLQTPLWIPQSVWLAGYVVFALIALLTALRAAILLARRDWRTIDRELGSPDVMDEIEASGATLDADARPVTAAGRGARG